MTDVSKGPVVHLAHLSHPFSWAGFTSQGVGGQLFLPSSVVPCWPTCGCAAVSVPFAHGGQLSGEIITALAPSPLNRHRSCVCVFVGMLCICQSRRWSGLQSPSTNEQMKHQLNENRKAALSINIEAFPPPGHWFNAYTSVVSVSSYFSI